MEIVVRGRHAEVPERFRAHVLEKLAKVEKLAPKALRVDAEVSRERNPRLADRSYCVELTVRSKGPVIRAEACAEDPYSALDVALDRLVERLRRAADRRRVHHGSHTPVSVAAATSAVTENGPAHAADEDVAGSDWSPVAIDGEGPMVIREKVHQAVPMSLDQALYEMELVGHDFFLFVDERTGRPSVVYRRRGYDYGVIRLDVRQPALA